MTVEDDRKRHRIRNRLSNMNEKIEDELDFQNYGATSDLDYEMSKARIAGYNTEIAKLEKLLQ